MEKVEASVEGLVAVAGVSIVPIARVAVKYYQTKSGSSFYGIKRPVAVVLVSGSKRKAILSDGTTISVTKLIKLFPEIKDSLRSVITGSVKTTGQKRREQASQGCG